MTEIAAMKSDAVSFNMVVTFLLGFDMPAGGLYPVKRCPRLNPLKLFKLFFLWKFPAGTGMRDNGRY